MFEEKRRVNKGIGIIIAGLMLFIAFSIGYYISMGVEDNTNSFSKINDNLKVPESLKDVTSIDINRVLNQEETVEEEDFILNENIKIQYITFFTICGHRIDKTIDLPSAFIGLQEEEFMENNPGWNLAEISGDIITLTREIETHCPKHFIIGIEEEYIAIYTYDENGNKILKEKTDININTLMPEDQIILESGIVADTEDDMEQKLEGFSN